MSKVVFVVSGMHCAHCKTSIERALAALPGVTEAQVDLGRQLVEVAYDAAAIDPARLSAAIEELGFAVEAPAP